MASSRSAELVGRVLSDRYRLLRPIGTGGSAHVYAADDVVLRRQVAVKVLHPGLAGDEAFGRRFRAEARAVAGLRHPHILEVFDTGEDEGVPFVVMRLLGGGSLRSLLDRGQLLTLAQAARVGADVAHALAYAHRQGLVHRDIKPANLIFDDDASVTVADFGLARALAEATWTEPIGGIVGTARYAAPEQVRAERLDGRADVYSLALVLVESITGTVPFVADSTVGTLFGRLEQPVPVPPEFGVLGPVLERAGTVSPADRLTASELAAELEAVASLLPPPGALPLTGLSDRVEVERDDAPTEIPGIGGLSIDGSVPPTAAARAFALADFPLVLPESESDGSLRAERQSKAAEAEPGWSSPTLGAADAEASIDASEVGPDPAGVSPSADPNPPGRKRRRLVAGAVVVVLGAAGGVGAFVITRPPPSYPVPVLTGKDKTDAASMVTAEHLRLAVTSQVYDGHLPAGRVISQSPAVGKLREGSAVDVTLSLGPQPIPVPTALSGRSESDAEAVITTLGLRVGTVSSATSMTVVEGAVISSTPSSGMLLPGQMVSLLVSSGKPFVAVPTLSGAAASGFAAARAALGAVGLAASETDLYSNTVPQGAVIATSPAAGGSVREGTTVVVSISKGPHTVTVPPVANLSIPAATQLLTADGLVVTGVTGNPTAAAVGSSPSAGSVVLFGSHVTIITN